METADGFAGDYCLLLEEAKKQDKHASEEMTKRTIQLTKKYRDFKAAGADGIIDCRVRSVILPLLADHVLREANHYLRLLENEKENDRIEHGREESVRNSRCASCWKGRR